MRTYPLFLSVLLFALISCSKDADSDSMPCTTPEPMNYNPMTVGNYWVYDRYTVDNDGMEALAGQDSVVIVGDTVIDGRTFFNHQAFSLTGSQSQIGAASLSDSSDYVIHPSGDYYFSSTDESDTLNYHIQYTGDFSWWSITSMDFNQQIITTNAGSFECIDRISKIDTDLESAQDNFPKYDHTYFAEGIGRVRFNYNYFQGSGQIRYDLNRYWVQ